MPEIIPISDTLISFLQTIYLIQKGSEYSYIGVGVEYREGSEYGWYACVMVGSVNYG